MSPARCSRRFLVDESVTLIWKCSTSASSIAHSPSPAKMLRGCKWAKCSSLFALLAISNVIFPGVAMQGPDVEAALSRLMG
jgi:hypothetical protein